MNKFSLMRSLAVVLFSLPMCAPLFADDAIETQSKDAAQARLRELEQQQKERLERAGQQAKQLAVMVAELRAFAERPRKAFVGARHRSEPILTYVNACLDKIVEYSRHHYPEHIKGIYGSALMSFEIVADGEISKWAVVRSSGKPELDEAAIDLVKAAAPCEPFSPELRQTVDILVVARTFTFSNEKIARESSAAAKP